MTDPVRGGSAIPVLPPRLSIARLPTPFRCLERLSDTLPGDTRIWVKHDDLTSTELSGNKIRKLEFTLAQAIAEGCDTLITCGGLQSNHCRTTALLGARLGLSVHLLLRGDEPLASQHVDGNLLLDQLSGATLHFIPENDYATHPKVARELIATLAQQGRKAFFIPIGASDEIGLWGYVAAGAELRADFARATIRPDAVVCATGSGGTQSGLIAANALYELETRVLAFAVCDDAAWFQNKVRGDLRRWAARYEALLPASFDVERLAIETCDAYIGPGYAKAGPEIFETIALLARTEGLVLDPVYTAKAFYGLLQELRWGKLQGARDIVFIHTGGIFGLFPQRHGFDQAQ